MKRRDFLRWLGVGAAVAVAAPALSRVPAVTPASLMAASGWGAPPGLAVGDVFTIEGVYAVHPHRAGTLQRFVITAVSAGE